MSALVPAGSPFPDAGHGPYRLLRLFQGAAVRAFDAKRYAESLRIAKEVQSGSPEQGVRQQAAYVAGRSASELNKRDEARDAFAIAARSNDPVIASVSKSSDPGGCSSDRRAREPALLAGLLAAVALALGLRRRLN